MAARRDEEVLPVRRSQNRVEPLAACAGMERNARAVGVAAVHGEPRAVEVVARRREDDEMEPRRRLVALVVAPGVSAPEEWVVERVEVGALWNRRPLGCMTALCPTAPCRRASSVFARVPTASLASWGTVWVPSATSIPGRKVVETRSAKSKFKYQASTSSKMCERCMAVPPRK